MFVCNPVSGPEDGHLRQHQPVLFAVRGRCRSGLTKWGFTREVADCLVFMDAGAIVEAASPDTFFDNPKSDRAKLFLEQIP